MLSVQQLLDRKPKGIFSVKPDEPVFAAIQKMAEHHVGALLVMVGDRLAGIVSERDYARKVVLLGRSSSETPVSDIMVRNVITTDIGKTFADCLKLMHSHGVRHLPVTENGVAVAVISVRDLLGEAVAHHAKVIGELELERLTMLTSTA